MFVFFLFFLFCSSFSLFIYFFIFASLFLSFSILSVFVINFSAPFPPFFFLNISKKFKQVAKVQKNKKGKHVASRSLAEAHLAYDNFS